MQRGQGWRPPLYHAVRIGHAGAFHALISARASPLQMYFARNEYQYSFDLQGPEFEVNFLQERFVSVGDNLGACEVLLGAAARAGETEMVKCLLNFVESAPLPVTRTDTLKSPICFWRFKQSDHFQGNMC